MSKRLWLDLVSKFLFVHGQNFRNIDERKTFTGNHFSYVTQLLGEYTLRNFRTQVNLAIFIVVDFNLKRHNFEEFEFYSEKKQFSVLQTNDPKTAIAAKVYDKINENSP